MLAIGLVGRCFVPCVPGRRKFCRIVVVDALHQDGDHADVIFAAAFVRQFHQAVGGLIRGGACTRNIGDFRCAHMTC